MGKFEKQIGEEKHSDLKKLEPLPDRHQKGKPAKKKFPPHWQVRAASNMGIYAHPSKWKNESWMYAPIGKNLYGYSDAYKTFLSLLKASKLDEALELYAKFRPETANWPVRFIHTAPLPTAREVI